MQAPTGDGDDDEEATGFFDIDGSASAKPGPPPPPALGTFEGEATEFLDGDDLDGMRVEGEGAAKDDGPDSLELDSVAASAADSFGVEMAGFDEDATEIFFNTEDDEGDQQILNEIKSGAPPAPSTIRIASSMPPREPVAAASSRPAPNPDALPRPARSGKRTARITAEMAAVQIRRTERTSMIMLVVGLLLLGLSVAGLIAKTRVGVALGLRRATVGSIEIRTTPPVPASVKLDEIFRGQAPMRMDGVQAGSHRVEIEAAGYLKVTRDVHLEGGTTALLDVSMVRIPQ